MNSMAAKQQRPDVAKRSTLKNVVVDKGAFDTIMRALIASKPIRQDDIKPKRKKTAAKKRAKG